MDRQQQDARLVATLRERVNELRTLGKLHDALHVEGMADQIEHDWSRGWARRQSSGVPETWGLWQTPRGRVVRAYRGAYNRVRFYDGNGRQLGPEQSNVAPAIAYAMSRRWQSMDGQ